MSLDDLVASTRVGRATIYRQFGSEEGLFKYLLEEEIGRFAGHEIAMPDAPGLLAGMPQLARAVLERHLEERSLTIHRLLIQEIHRVPELAHRYYDVQLNLLRQPMALLFARFGRGAADDYCVEAFHILTTFGMRYLAPIRRRYRCCLIRLLRSCWKASCQRQAALSEAVAAKLDLTAIAQNLQRRGTSK